MKKGIYRKLAWSGMKKNKKLYLPYIVTCIGAVMMCYIVGFLATSHPLQSIPGGSTMQMFLSMGFYIMAVFSLIFLFYTNSFLIRRRKKEFGLYNILGLDKKSLSVVLAVESILIAFFSIGGGLLGGIVFSKMGELAMLKILNSPATYSFSVNGATILHTVILFLGIFFLIFCNTLRQIHLNNPIELLRSENAGERPPKANWIAAVLGVLMLAVAYCIAIIIKEPLTALFAFCLAVILVIVATYLLFIAGSVSLCRILQKNKRYYYKTNHFVSVSSMMYRMRRNGAGLASICILCTMVLVTVSSTTCLFVNTENAIHSIHPREIEVTADASQLEQLDSTYLDEAVQMVTKSADAMNMPVQDVLTYRTIELEAAFDGNSIAWNLSDSSKKYGEIWNIVIVPLSDYNKTMGTQESLAVGEALLYTTEPVTLKENTIQMGDSQTFSVRKQVSEFSPVKNSVSVYPTMYLFVPDFSTVATTLQQEMTQQLGNADMLKQKWYYAFNTAGDDSSQILLADKIATQFKDGKTFAYTSVQAVAGVRSEVYGLYGGLFFLGVLLGIVFLFAAVLIIYYKQISEGYEDQSRFEIMQKVGMTKREIQKSIHSQLLTVFFLPLLVAGVHLAFAFPIIKRILLLFGLSNLPLLIITTLCCYVVFGLFYLAVYSVTSHSYLNIVSGAKQ